MSTRTNGTPVRATRSAGATGAPTTVHFTSGDVRCEAWHFEARSDALTGHHGRPCVVMAHGLAGTKDSGLQPFAEALADAGCDVLAFDYRSFGGSDGSPRQVVSVAGQQADYRAAIHSAKQLPGVDPRRIVLWGVSLGGGHVLAVAAGREDVAAVVAVVPLVDGLAAARLAMKQYAPVDLARSTALGLKAKASALLGRDQVRMPVVAHPGEVGAMTLPGAEQDYYKIAGPTWMNWVDASITAELGKQRPIKLADKVRCPVLVQIADFDRSAPPHSAQKAAFKARAEVRHYPGDHFDLFAGFPFHAAALEHQVHFLTRHLGVAKPAAEVPAQQATPTTKKTAAKAPARKSTTKKTAAKKTAAKKAPVKKSAAKKSAAKKTATKKTAAKKTPATRAAAKKTTTKKVAPNKADEQ